MKIRCSFLVFPIPGKGLAGFIGGQLISGTIEFNELFSYTFYFTTACGIPVLIVYHLVVKRRYEEKLIREKKELLERVRAQKEKEEENNEDGVEMKRVDSFDASLEFSGDRMISRL